MVLGSLEKVGSEGKDPGMRHQHSLNSKYLSMMISPKMFSLDIFYLTNLIDNNDYQNSIKKYPVLLFYLWIYYLVKVELLF